MRSSAPLHYVWRLGCGAGGNRAAFQADKLVRGGDDHPAIAPFVPVEGFGRPFCRTALAVMVGNTTPDPRTHLRLAASGIRLATYVRNVRFGIYAHGHKIQKQCNPFYRP